MSRNNGMLLHSDSNYRPSPNQPFRFGNPTRPRFTGLGRSAGIPSLPPFNVIIADGFGSSASAEGVLHSLPGASGIRLERGLELSVTSLERTESNNEKFHTFLVLKMPRLAVNQICGCYVELTSKDQSSGDRKSRVGLGGLGDFTLDPTGHDATTVARALDIPLFFGDGLNGLRGDTVGLKFYYVVADGGEHEIRVEKLLIRLFTYEGLARATLNYLFTFRAIAAAAVGALSRPRYRHQGGQGQSVALSLSTILPKDVQCVVLSYLEIPLEYLLFDAARVRAAAPGDRLPPEIVPFSVLHGRYSPQIADPASSSPYALPAEDKGCCVAQ